MSYKLPAVAIAAVVIAASPAHARDGQAYVGIEAGAMFIDDIEASATEPFDFVIPLASPSLWPSGYITRKGSPCRP